MGRRASRGSQWKRLANSSLQRRRAASGSQRGDLLIEVLIATAILSGLVVSAMFALGTLVKVASTHQAIARTSNEASIVAEFVERMSYVKCNGTTPTSQTYQDTLTGSTSDPYSQPSGLQVSMTVVAVNFLESSSAAEANFVASCPAGGDQGVQRLSVNVVSQTTNGKSIRSRLQFFKRDNSCAGLSGAEVGQTC